MPFTDESAESDFRLRTATSCLRTDVGISALTVIWLASYCCKHWQNLGLERGVAWAGLLAELTVPVLLLLLGHHYLRVRHLVIAGVRLVECGAMAALSRNALPAYDAAATLPRLLHTVLASKACGLALSALGRRLPFQQHLAIHTISTLIALAANARTCAEMCVGGDAGANTALIDGMLRVLSLAGKPAAWVTGAPETALMLPDSPVAQCWLTFGMQVVMLGAVLPSVPLYCWERTARAAYLQENAALLLSLHRRQRRQRKGGREPCQHQAEQCSAEQASPVSPPMREWLDGELQTLPCEEGWRALLPQRPEGVVFIALAYFSATWLVLLCVAHLV